MSDPKSIAQARSKLLSEQLSNLSASCNVWISNLASEHDQANARLWSQRIIVAAANKLTELELKVKLMLALLHQCRNKKLVKPFNVPPTFRNLSEITPIPNLKEIHDLPDDLRLPLIMQKSPDRGAFLVSQPVPKCGAFCYLAVVARPPNQ